MTFAVNTCGAGASGNNVSSLSLALPNSWLPGDIHIARFQNYGGGAAARLPLMPAGWTNVCSGINSYTYHHVWYRVAQSGDTSPVMLTTTGTGVAGDTQVARIFGFRPGANKGGMLIIAGTISTNGSADNVGPLSSINVATGDLVIASAGKSNDFNGQGVVSSYTQFALDESTTGNDAGASLLYALSFPLASTGAVTVTDDGGTASNGIGIGVLLAFREYNKNTATKDDALSPSDDSVKRKNLRRAKDDTAEIEDGTPQRITAFTYDQLLSLTDTKSRGGIVARTVNDLLAVDDGLPQRIHLLTFDYLITTLDNLISVYTPPPETSLIKVVSDSVVLSEQLIHFRHNQRGLDDPLEPLDSATAIKWLRHFADDAVDIIDSAVHSAFHRRDTTTTLAVNDGALRALIRARITASLLNVTDSATSWRLRNRWQQESIAAQDELTQWRLRSRTASDPIALSDATALTLLRRRLLDDVLVVVDAVLAATTQESRIIVRSKTDETVITDAVTRARIARRLVTELLNPSPDTIRRLLRARIETDSAILRDETLRARLLRRLEQDEIPVLDEALRFALRPREGTDALGLIDYLTRSALHARGSDDSILIGDPHAQLTLRVRSLVDFIDGSDGVATIWVPAFRSDVRIRIGAEVPDIQLARALDMPVLGVSELPIRIGGYNA